MRRKRFLGLGAAFAALPRAARATGGLDVESAESSVVMRVLLAAGAFPEPEPLDAWRFAWNGRSYRGSHTIVRLLDGRAGLVNTLPLDAYLYGVLGKEISASWAFGAQRAQAIAARTYALGKLRPAAPFDAVAAESDQHYGGIEGESVECRAAVDATAAQIVTYGAAPARVAYSACCGGCTAAAADVWKTPEPYLVGVPDPYCVDSPNFAWSAELALGDTANPLATQVAGLGDLRDVRIDVRRNGARPVDVAFVGSASTLETTPAAVRNAFGATLVRSTFLHTASVGGGGRRLTLGGTGHGHGVGMCQWGARNLGRTGAGAEEILTYYFPGTGIGRA